MAHALVNLESLRGAIDATEGAATTPTRLLYIPKGGGIIIGQGVESIRDERAWNKGDHVANIYPGMQDVVVRISNMPLSFEDAAFWLSGLCGSMGETPATVDTTAYSRTGTPSQTDFAVSATGTRCLHLQFSTSDLIGTVGWSVPGLFFEEVELTFKKRASGTDTGVMLSGTLRTASAATQITAFTGSLSDRAQTLGLGQQLKSFVDTSTIGSTADANITEATLRISRPASFHDGMDDTGLHTSSHRAQGWTTQLSILRKFSDKTELDAYLGASFAKTLRKVRILVTGGLVGAVSAKNTIRADWYGKWVDQGEFGGVLVDGIWYQRFTGDGIFDATATASYILFTQNSIAAAHTTA